MEGYWLGVVVGGAIGFIVSTWGWLAFTTWALQRINEIRGGP